MTASPLSLFFSQSLPHSLPSPFIPSPFFSEKYRPSFYGYQLTMVYRAAEGRGTSSPIKAGEGNSTGGKDPQNNQKSQGQPKISLPAVPQEDQVTHHNRSARGPGRSHASSLIGGSVSTSSHEPISVDTTLLLMVS